MIVYIDTVATGEMWLEANGVYHDSGGGYTKIKIRNQKNRMEYFWTSIRIMMINDKLIIKDGKRK